MYLVVDVTGHCNLHCNMCYHSEFVACSPPVAELKRVINESPAQWELHFLGGEPLMRPDFLDLLRLSVSAGHKTSFVTNATLIDVERAEAIVATGVNEVAVSLDGATADACDAMRGQGTFHACMNGLRLLDAAIRRVRASTTLSISTTATRENLRSVLDIPPMLNDSGVHIESFTVTPVRLAGRAEGRPQSKLSQAEWLDLSDALCAQWKTFERLCFLSLPNPECVSAYLAAIHGTQLVRSLAYCMVITREHVGRVLPTGEVVPCSTRLGLLREYNRRTHGRASRSIAQLVGEPACFEEFIRDIAPLAKPCADICGECPYRTSCHPCPLDRMLGGADGNLLPSLCGLNLERARVKLARPQASISDLGELAGLTAERMLPYVKERRFGELLLCLPGQDHVISLTGDLAVATRLLLEHRSVARAIDLCEQRAMSLTDAVVAVKSAVDGLRAYAPAAVVMLSRSGQTCGDEPVAQEVAAPALEQTRQL